MKNTDALNMDIAKRYAVESHCQRKKVGAVFVKENRVITNGFNGTLPGQPNVCEGTDGNTSDTVLHAEQNALMYAAKHGIALNATTCYVTLSPCITCGRLMAAAGITEVVYDEEYRDTAGIDFLNAVGVTCRPIGSK